MPHIFTSKNNCVFMRGTSVVLLNGRNKNAEVIKGEGNLGANKMVGIISHAPRIMPPIPYVPYTKVASPAQQIFEGGELLNKISKISFKNNSHHNKRDNIKFVF